MSGGRRDPDAERLADGIVVGVPCKADEVELSTPFSLRMHCSENTC